MFFYYIKISEKNKSPRSSHLDYIGIGKKNFPSVTQREFVLKILGGKENYKQNIKKWLKEIAERKDMKEFKMIAFE